MSTPRVILQPYDPLWVGEYLCESGIVSAAFGDALLEIHHIGSTAIPGIHAKPIIDMLAVTSDLTRIDECTPLIEERAYEALGEFGIPGRHGFTPTAEDAWDIYYTRLPQATPDA